MNWPRFVLHGVLALLAGLVAVVGARALFPELSPLEVAAIGGAVTGLCVPIVVGRGRTSKGTEKLSPIEDADNDQGQTGIQRPQ